MTEEQRSEARREFEGIRDERGRYANTATRIGNAFLRLLDLVGGETGQYLSKTDDDEAQGEISFLKGIKIGIAKLFGWSPEGNINANEITADSVIKGDGGIRTDEIRSNNYTGDAISDTGYLLSNNVNGRSKLIIDELYVRIKAVFEAMEVKRWSVTAGDEIRSCASNTIARVDYFDGSGKMLGYSITRVPWLLKGIPFLLSKFSKGLGRKIYSTVRRVRVTLTQEQLESVRTCRCYFLAKDGEREIENWWKADSEYGHDYARCQTMNLKNSVRETFTPITQKAGNVFWWRKLTGVSTNPVELEKKKMYHYIDVAYNYVEEQGGQTTYAAAGSDIPAAGDDVVQFGNDINPGRMNAIINQVNGGGRFDYETSDAPCTKYYKGIYTFNLNKCWFGGHPCKAILSPSSGYRFHGPEFKFITETGEKRVEIQLGAWTDLPLEDDDYGRSITYSDDDKTHKPATKVRKVRYYESVSHKGCTWLCSIAEDAHWVAEQGFTHGGTTYSAGKHVPDAVYAALSDANKVLCIRRENYTISEPDWNSPDWTLLTERGDSSVQIFKWFDGSVTSVSAPEGSTGSTIPPTGWSLTAPNREKEGWHLWMSTGMKGSDGKLLGTWSVPVRISGDKGTAGEDASDREWIYFLTANAGGWSDPNVLKDKDGTARTADYIAETDDFVPYGGWSDNAQAVSADKPFLYATWREKPRGNNEKWGSFNTPIVWSHWGRNGIDGDGVEYVYMRTKKNVAPEVDHTQTGYDAEEFLPTIINKDACEAESNRCTDDATGPDSTYLYEWAISRTMTTPDSVGKRSWPKFTGKNNDYKMSLWSNFAKSITKTGEAYRYATNNTGTRPAANSSDWKTTRPSLQKGYWLFTEITISWSDGSTTVLYTDERNPNDGIAGQDIIVDGATDVKYAVTDSNTSHPAESSSDWKDISQVTQTQGKWLWSKATTYYRKASSAAGAHDAGYSVNYNVVYIAKDGTDGRSVTKITEYYKATSSSAAMSAPTSDSGWSTDPNLSDLTNKWGSTYKYLWNYEKIEFSSGTTVERTVPQLLAIWTKDGAAGKGIDSITNYYKITNNATPPARIHEGGQGWDDDPLAPGQGQYLWNYEKINWVNPAATTYTEVQLICYMGIDGADGKDGKDGKDGTNGKDGKDGENAPYEVRDYALGSSYTTPPTSGWQTSAPTRSIGTFVWMRIRSYSGTGTLQNTTYVCLTGDAGNDGSPGAPGAPGAPGSPGKAGRWYDYAGLWGTDISSVTNTAKVGYFVRYNGHFYMNTKDDDVANTTTPANSSGTANSGWERISDERQFFITKAIFGDYAQFGSFIFNGDWLISTLGTLVDGSGKESDTSFILMGNSVNSGLIVCKVAFTVASTTSVKVSVIPSSESSYDYGAVGTLDSTALADATASTIKSGTGCLVKASGTDTAEATVSVSAGSHFFYIAYAKDSSTHKNSDNATFVFGDIQNVETTEIKATGGMTYGSGYGLSTSYRYFDPQDPEAVTFATSGGYKFRPNFAVDGKTGRTYQNAAYIRGTVYAMSGIFQGIIKASAMYQNWQNVYEAGTIEPAKGTAINILSASSSMFTLTLPPAANFPFVTLTLVQTYAYRTRTAIYGAYISAPSGAKMISATMGNTSTTMISQFTMPWNRVMKIHSIGGVWILDGDESAIEYTV